MNPSLSRGLSSFDMRHNLVASFHYKLPGSTQDAACARWLSGWALPGIARFTSGLPVTLLNNNDTSLLGTIPNGINNNGVDTPDWSGKSLTLHTNPRGGAAVFDASQLTLPALGTMGNARRRFFSGPGMENLDATVSRSFLVERRPLARVSRRGVQRVQPRAVFRRGGGGRKYFQRQLRPGGKRDAAAADAGGAALSVLTIGGFPMCAI